jgi:serine protease Do
MKTGNIPLLVILFAATLTPVGAAQQDAFSALEVLSDSFQRLSERVNPSVVVIYTTGYVPAQGLVAGQKLFSKQTRAGSGVVVDPNGYIVTNAHVVAGASKVQVRFSRPRNDDSERRSILRPHGDLLGAQVVGLDYETDLAVLKVQKKTLPALPLGDSDDVEQGQLVFAYGSPRGLENSVTMGVVSATARQIREEDPMIYIQTDAEINPGNSGGPLVNTQGEVVGINTFIVSGSGGSEGLGFAAPSNIVRYVFEQIRKSGRVSRGEIGARAQTITPILARGLGLDRDWGVILSDVYPLGKASEAGLRVGDIILTLDGKVMENGRQFRVNLYRHAVGETVDLEILRGTQKLTFRVPISDSPNDPNRFADMVRPEDNLIQELGILVIELDRRVMLLLPGLRTRQGVVVAARSVETPMIEALGLLPGDVIFSVNQTPIESIANLRDTAEELQPGDTVVFQIERSMQLMYVPVEVPR